MNFIINNQNVFQTNSSIHHSNARNKHHPHRPNANLPCFQKSTLYAGINIFDILLPSMTILKNDKAEFKAALRKYLNKHFLYSVHEFLCVNVICYIVLWNVCSILHHINCVYLCVYDLFCILLFLWHTFGSMESVCACVHVHVCVHHWILKVKDTSLLYMLQDGDVCDRATFGTCTNGKSATCQRTHIEKQQYVDYLHAFNIFGIFWGLFFVSALGQMILAGTFATWYWTFNKSDVPFFTVTLSTGRTFRWVLMLVAWFILSMSVCVLQSVLVLSVQAR